MIQYVFFTRTLSVTTKDETGDLFSSLGMHLSFSLSLSLFLCLSFYFSNKKEAGLPSTRTQGATSLSLSFSLFFALFLGSACSVTPHRGYKATPNVLFFLSLFFSLSLSLSLSLSFSLSLSVPSHHHLLIRVAYTHEHSLQVLMAVESGEICH